jgi:hypothetical protein
MMLEEKRKALAQLSAKLERRKKIEAMLKSLQDEEWNLTQRKRSLEAALCEEEADVDRLERTTATSIFYSVLGKKDEKLDKEQQEAYTAKLKYDAAVHQLDDCKLRIDELRQEKAALSDCTGEYEQVFAEIKEILLQDPSYADQLCALHRQHGEIVSQLRELDEAISAGNAAMHQIKCIESSLDSAEDWGTWDVVGGGLLSDLQKHSYLDEAQCGAEHLQVLLSRFRTELADVHINKTLGTVNVDGFLRFADYFFDGLIADWSVLSRIHDSQESVYQARLQVGDALLKLDGLKDDRAKEKAAVEKQIADLVTNAC